MAQNFIKIIFNIERKMESHNQAITKAKPGFLFYFYFYLFIYFILFLGANFRHLVTKNNPAV
jgi:hypothetical protein